MSTSPNVHETKMDWWDATRDAFNGHRVTRLEWDDPFCYCLMHGGRLSIHNPDGVIYSWTVNDGDMAAEDWVRVQPS